MNEVFDLFVLDTNLNTLQRELPITVNIEKEPQKTKQKNIKMVFIRIV